MAHCLALDTGCDRRHYQAPDASVREIAVILPGDGDQVRGSQNFILYHNSGQPLQHISDVHPFYPSLHYVHLFLTGQLSWHPNIVYHTADGKHQHVSLVQYHLVTMYRVTSDGHASVTCENRSEAQ